MFTCSAGARLSAIPSSLQPGGTTIGRGYVIGSPAFIGVPGPVCLEETNNTTLLFSSKRLTATCVATAPKCWTSPVSTYQAASFGAKSENTVVSPPPDVPTSDW